MNRNKGIVKKRKVVFSKGPIHLVDCDVTLPAVNRKGKREVIKISRQIIEHPGAVVVIPQIGSNRYLLIRQFRFAARDWLWEWPAGGIERGESLRMTARRELMEEAGYMPRQLKKVLSFYPTPGISSEVMHLFLAQNLVSKKAEGDEDERIEVREFTFSQIGQMIKKGRICDGKTILGYLLLKDLTETRQ